MSTPVDTSSRARRLELIFGVIIPAVILGPMLMFGLLGIVVTGASGGTPEESKGVMQALLAMSLAGIFGIAAVAAAVLMGPERIRRRPILRFSVALALVVGIAAGSFAMWSQRSSVAWSTGASGNLGALFIIVPGLLALGGPIVVALRRLPSLLAK